VSAEFRAEVEATLEGGETEDLLGVIIDLALAAEDARWAEDCLLGLAAHPDTDVRGNALVAFAQLADRFGGIHRERVQPVLVAALDDAKAYVRGQATAALEELGWAIDDRAP